MKSLNQLRSDLDQVDKTLLDLIFQRFSIVKDIFILKKQKDLDYKDKNREEDIWSNFWQLWDSNTTYSTKADWPYFSKILKVMLDQSFSQGLKAITRKKK